VWDFFRVIIRVGYTAQSHNLGDVLGGDTFDGLQGLGRALVAEAVVAGHQSRCAVAAEEGVSFD